LNQEKRKNTKMKTTCSTETSTAEGSATEQCCGPAKCLVEAGSNCPIEGATEMWAKSFEKAMCEAQTEILKSKILKAWGEMMEQAADAMIETMGAVWAEKIAEVRAAEAKSAFQSRLRDLWLQDKKK
jgi:hypothetical protein